MKERIQAFFPMALILAFFTTIAIVLGKTTGSLFYLMNFLIIGTCIALGMGLWPILPLNRKGVAHKVSQILVGGYMFFGLGFGLVYLAFGFIMPENMQIEGFWLWLFSGVFQAAVIHYLIAKILGPLIFGRGWCGWACWTVAVLDLLPWKKSPGRLARRWEHLRYLSFALSFALMSVLVFGMNHSLKQHVGILPLSTSVPEDIPAYSHLIQIPELWWFLAGNLVYYAAGILIAAITRDNRAFCKYLCPVAPFLKLGSRFSVLKIRPDPHLCTDCRKCERRCPMDIHITSYVQENSRVTSSECIICQSCVSSCPKRALSISMGFDGSFKDRLMRKRKPAALSSTPD
ncbi:MAG: 4Fe-4S binding protein [Spirochaetota bacterium]